MRLLHVHSGNLYGGVETLLRTIAQCRDLCPNMEPEFALCFDGRIAEELRQARAPVHMLGPVRLRYPMQIMRVRQHLLEILSTGSFDALICHMAWVFAIFGPAAHRVEVPLIFWMHDAVRRRNWLTRWAGRLIPDLVICNSRFTASTLERLFARASYETLYYPVARPSNGSECAEREVVRTRLDTPCDAVVLIQSSRMEAWKGHDLLLDALAQISNVPQWICWIAGGAQRNNEAAYEKHLHARAAALGLNDRIRFLGQRSDVAQLMTAADIFCQPNRDAEPFGVALIEAMYAGLPVVTTAAGGPVEIVDESCGILVQPNNVASLADELQHLIRDVVLRRRLGAAGSRRASQLCDPSRQLHRLQLVLQELIRSRPARSTFASISE